MVGFCPRILGYLGSHWIKEFDGESGDNGKLPLSEWNQFIQAGKDGTIIDNDFCVFDFDNEFTPPWSAKIMIANRTKRLSDKFEFRKLLGERAFVLCTYESWFSDEEVDHDKDVEWQDDRYHLVDEPKELEEISDMFVELDQAMHELDKVIKAGDVIDLFAVYYQAIDDEGDVVLVEVVAEEMVAKEAVDGDDANDRDVIPHELYAAIVAQEGVFSSDDGDVIPDELYAEVVAQEGGGLVNYGDVIPYEVVAEEMLKDQTRSIKGRRVMADKENDDDAQ
ncbi:hypothetical protein Tco_1030416 [Tanacetum coccineum]|uniref:Uncharacterized protein n=1 Tax=Tanacetum coccineum TaxID=301880 RepID=A0ABQ5G7K5_9ASTR